MCRTQSCQNSLHRVLHEKQTNKTEITTTTTTNKKIKKNTQGKCVCKEWKDVMERLLFPLLSFFRTGFVPLTG